MISSGDEPFLFGCADAAHHVEGGNSNDWTIFEETVPNAIAGDTPSGIACDHRNRYEEDLDLLVSLGANAYRFSIEWSRIEPQEGIIDHTELAYYGSVIAACRARNLEPVVTLHHFTLPVWVAEQGGLLSKGIEYAFAKYVALVVATIGDSVKWWITVNEPNVLAVMGYLFGNWPPQHKSLKDTFHALRTLMRMHAVAYVAIHDCAARHGWDVTVSLAHHYRPFFPENPYNPGDILGTRLSSKLFNEWILTACTTGKLSFPIGRGEEVYGLAHSLDYLGLNYYAAEDVHLSPHGLVNTPQHDRPLSDMGWAIDPELFAATLEGLWNTWKLPILITENGVADRKDELRSSFLNEHIQAVIDVKNNGIPILGYMYWTLMDNFEWIEGYTKTFGLYSVDRTTLERTPKPSAAVFRELANRVVAGSNSGSKRASKH